MFGGGGEPAAPARGQMAGLRGKCTMALGKTYKVISTAKSRKVAEGIAGGAEDDGLERVRIKKVEGARL